MEGKNTLQERPDVKIVGSGGSAGGIVGKLNIVGDGEFNGDVDALSFKCTGNAVVYGKLKTGSLKLTGELIIHGSLEGGKLNTTGKLQVGGDLYAKTTKLSGETIARGQINGEQIELSGYNTVRGGCQAEEFKLHGSMQMDGMLNAEIVEMKLFGDSRIKEIGGGQIRIKPSGGVWAVLGMFNNGGSKRLSVDSIEGDIIELENTEVGFVRGSKVTIGPGCRIGLVEYIESFHQDTTSKIEQCNQIGK
ncbi:Polymer-forming cytoskeletal [compost metagenome]